MPPLRSERAPKACDNCRRLKTRCYPSRNGAHSCLRCETQNQDCSLRKSTRQRAQLHNHDAEVSYNNVDTIPTTGIEDRLARLENVVHKLTESLDLLIPRAPDVSISRETSLVGTASPASSASHDAPVLMIREIAENVQANQADRLGIPENFDDPIFNGLISIEDGYELLSLFRTHYSRWINLDEQKSLEQLMSHVRTSSLLLYSICLVAVRHTRNQNINKLAPTFFHQAKSLLQVSLLKIPQPLEFFQASLLISLWSTTIGQVPLSIDSWLLTGYALQQGSASSITEGLKELPFDDQRLSASCTWNHICVAHLQYCVGTGRNPVLQEPQVKRCDEVLDFKVSQFEVRMVAELQLYWLIVKHCCAPSVNLTSVRKVLSTWKTKWSFLFDQPRSQFLDMSYNFAILLACCRLVHLQPSKLSRSKLNEMIQLARTIIRLAMSHTDERTPHLTDHIYHMITFSAITLCQLITKYPNALIEPNTITSVNKIIFSLIDWLHSIGLESHISHLLANIIAAHYSKCTAHGSTNSSGSTNVEPINDVSMHQNSNTHPLVATSYAQADTSRVDCPCQDLSWTTFYDFSIDSVVWPESNELFSNDHTPTEESWTMST